MNNSLGYPDEVWRLFTQTPRAGRCDVGPDVRTAEAATQAGKFRLRLDCRVEQGHIADSRFQAYGCPYTIAVGAWLANWCVNRPCTELREAPVAELRAALEIPEDRAHCWLLAQDVLRILTDTVP